MKDCINYDKGDRMRRGHRRRRTTNACSLLHFDWLMEGIRNLRIQKKLVDWVGFDPDRSTSSVALFLCCTRSDDC